MLDQLFGPFSTKGSEFSQTLLARELCSITELGGKGSNLGHTKKSQKDKLMPGFGILKWIKNHHLLGFSLRWSPASCLTLSHTAALIRQRVDKRRQPEDWCSNGEVVCSKKSWRDTTCMNFPPKVWIILDIPKVGAWHVDGCGVNKWFWKLHFLFRMMQLLWGTRF